MLHDHFHDNMTGVKIDVQSYLLLCERKKEELL